MLCLLRAPTKALPSHHRQKANTIGCASTADVARSIEYVLEWVKEYANEREGRLIKVCITCVSSMCVYVCVLVCLLVMRTREMLLTESRRETEPWTLNFFSQMC